MPILVDGCNLMGEMGILFRPGSDARLVEDYLIPYVERRPCKMTVIFDNCDYNSYQKNEFKKQGVRVVYAYPGINTADDVIIKFIKSSPHPCGIIVVSSDRALQDTARLFHCRVYQVGRVFKNHAPDIKPWPR